MVKEKGRVIEYDVKTKETVEYEAEIDLPDIPFKMVGLDFEKLKKVLLDKKIIKDYSEVE